ncbi:Mitochondrial GTPase 1 [Diatrype stigma]|uniref:Mitochondrial GTPase 1 n=1 Tax=Diatrype stigma TaxID=117547 RepID=A0AAN9YVU8_9PEZI
MAAPLKSAAGFVPRTVFEVSPSITRSYFLGHHAGALTAMRKVMSNIGLILECRDSRVPLSSANPLLESSLAGRDRIVVYTKADLCAPASGKNRLKKQLKLLSEWHAPVTLPSSYGEPEDGGDGGDGGGVGERWGGDGDDAVGLGRTEVVFTDEHNPRSIEHLLRSIRSRAIASHSIVGMRALVVGMPNAGKSTLLNALRREGMQIPRKRGRKGAPPPEPRQIAKAARTGAEPGVTRKMATPVRIMERDSYRAKLGHRAKEGVGEGVFLLDTPGVFVPYVSDVEAMLKLALVGCVKDGLVPAETVADYLLFRLNLRDPQLYAHLAAPTNDAAEFLEAVARRTGKLLRGGEPAIDHAADWVVQQWRMGRLGRFALDDVSDEGLRASRERRRKAAAGEGGGEPLSMNQARKREKEARKVRSAAKRAAASDSA